MWQFLLFLLLPLPFLLYHFGLAVSKSALIAVGRLWSLPSSWKGSLHLFTGSMSRNFVVFKKHRCLTVQLKGTAGTLSIEIREQSGSLLHSWEGSGPHSQQIDISGLNRLHCRLQGHNFQGSIAITLDAP